MFSIKCDWIGFYKMNCQDKSLSQLHCQEVSVLLQPLWSTAIRVSFELSGPVIVRRCLQCEQKVDTCNRPPFARVKSGLRFGTRIHEITDLTAKTSAEQNTAVFSIAHTSFNLVQCRLQRLPLALCVAVHFPYLSIFYLWCNLDDLLMWRFSMSFICLLSRPHLQQRVVVIRLMTGKQWLDILPYLPQTGAPEISQAENTESQNKEDQSESQSHSLVGVVLGLLLFSHLNLRKI